MNLNPTPKSQFLADPTACKEHMAMIDSAVFRRSLDAAKAAYVRAICDMAPGDLSGERYLEASAFAFGRLQGMNDFCGLLLNLAQEQQKPAARPPQNLEHKN
jgi:hypothetical protein